MTKTMSAVLALAGALLWVAGVVTTAAQTTEWVSVSSSGVQGSSTSFVGQSSSSVSANGRYVAFASFAFNLVSGDTNGYIDVFIRGPLDGCLFRDGFDSGDTTAWSSTLP